jgi:hypothetical protein
MSDRADNLGIKLLYQVKTLHVGNWLRVTGNGYNQEGNEMSIRLIAKELYRLRQQVEGLEEQLKISPPEKREEIANRLREQKAELIRVQRMLEGAKEPPPFRRPL